MATQKVEARTGVVPHVTHLALEVIDRGGSIGIAVLQDARAEIRAVADSAIELVEKSSASLVRFAKKVVQRVDDGVGETLTSADKLVSTAVKSARETAKAAADLAQVASQGLAGDRAAAQA